MTDQLHRRRSPLTLPTTPAAARFALRLQPRTIGISIAAGAVGAYLLLDATGRPVYVGRSDSCLRSRLLRHPLRGTATHFAASVTDTSRAAYLLECYWWHRFQRDDVRLLNLIHPIAAGTVACPFCGNPAAATPTLVA